MLAAVAVGLLKTDATGHVSKIALEVTVFAAASSAVGGLLVLARGASVYRKHLAAQALLGELIKILGSIKLRSLSRIETRF